MNKALRMVSLILSLGLMLSLGYWQRQGQAAGQALGGPKWLVSSAVASGRFAPAPLAAPAAPMATITVTSLGDGVANAANCPHATNCRLRDAIAKAVAGDTINFSVTGTITLTAAVLAGNPLVINKNLTITGPGAAQLTVSGNDDTNVFVINSGVTVAISGLRITDAIDNAIENGGGIRNAGNLTLTNCTLSGNQARMTAPPFVWRDGGAIYNTGTLTVTGSTLSNNAANQGGGIYNSGSLTITGGTTLSSNSAQNVGGGIYNSGTLTITASTLANNQSTSVGAGIFHTGAGPVALTNSTLSGNYTPETGAGIYSNGTGMTVTNSTLSGNEATTDGGGMRNIGTVTFINSTLSGNRATRGNGGGIDNSGTLTVTGGTLSGNSASNEGGGIRNLATLTVTGGMLSSNSATYGGAIHNIGTLTITASTFSANEGVAGGGLAHSSSSPVSVTNCTFSGNQAHSGGGIDNRGTGITITNSTLSGNEAGYWGGGIRNTNMVTFINSTLSGNRATTEFGGGFGGGISNTGTLNARNTLIAGNTAAVSDPDVDGALTSQGYNLIGNNSGATITPTTGDQIGTAAAPINPLLAPLANYGGPTQTHALLPGSPAINAGTNCVLTNNCANNNLGFNLTTDQRGAGFNRQVGSAVDIGAFESRGFTLAIAGGNNQSTNVNTAFANPLAVTVTASGAGEPTSGGKVTFTPPVSGASATIAGNPATISGSTATTGTVTANATGGAYSVMASATGAASVNFTLTNIVPNTPPTISDITNQTINEDNNTGALAFTVGDAQTPAANLLVAGSSSNTTLVPNANIVFGGAGANRTVTITPAANQAGTTTITVTVSDGSNITSDTFVLTVNAVNDNPTISNVTDQTINEDGTTGALAFTIGDVETPAANLTVAGGSSNTTLVPNANIVFGGVGASRTVTITPAANQSGSATITVTVSDGSGGSAPDSFVLTVNAVNDNPTVSNVTNQTINEDGTTSALAFTIGDVETPAANLTVAGGSSNTTLVPNASIVFGGSGASRTVTITPAPNQFGTATITLTVMDANGGVGNDTFLLTVNAVSDPPTISDVANQSISVNASTGALPVTVGDAETAAGSLTLTGSSSNTTLVPNANIVLGGSGANRTATVTPAANQSGATTITLTVTDGNGLTASDSFLLQVSACAASLSKTGQNFSAQGGTGDFTVTIAGGCQWTAVSNNPSFITVTAPAGTVTGNGTVSFSVASHSNTAARSGTITVAGQTFTVRQGAQFLDVPVGASFYEEIGKLSAAGVTTGCGSGNYCPNSSVTREAMAAFIIRALHEPGYVPPAPGAQRFADVPSASAFYAHIEEMAVRGITSGCGGNNYCPSDPVTRQAMAAFLIRALHEPGYVPSTNVPQRFNDVPLSNPFYGHIEEMAVRGITSGCGGGNYCPTQNVTRAQMAAFLVRAFGL